jgi:hypothetical protein
MCADTWGIVVASPVSYSIFRSELIGAREDRGDAMLWIVLVGFFAVLIIVTFNWTMSLEEDDYWLVKRRIFLGRNRAKEQATVAASHPDVQS